MENSLTVNLSPLQVILSLAFQLWMIIFPIVIIRKLNYLTELLQGEGDRDAPENESP